MATDTNFTPKIAMKFSASLVEHLFDFYAIFVVFAGANLRGPPNDWDHQITSVCPMYSTCPTLEGMQERTPRSIDVPVQRDSTKGGLAGWKPKL